MLNFRNTSIGFLVLMAFFAVISIYWFTGYVLLIALAVAVPRKALKYALICSIGSVLGGCFGYRDGAGEHQSEKRFIPMLRFH